MERHTPRKTERILTEEERREEARRTQEAEEIMEEELQILEGEEEMQMKLRFEEKEKKRQERIEEEELQILEGEEEIQMKLRFEEEGKMRHEREQRICPSNLTEEEKISQDINQHENRVARRGDPNEQVSSPQFRVLTPQERRTLESIKRRRHYWEPITPKQKLLLNQGALEIWEKKQVLAAVDPQDQGAPEIWEKKQVLAVVDPEDQAKADEITQERLLLDEKTRKRLLAEWKEQVQRIEDKQRDWLKLRFEEEQEKMRHEQEPPSDLTDEQKQVRLGLRYAKIKRVPPAERSDRARKMGKFKLMGLTAEEKKTRAYLKQKISKLE